MSKFLLEKDGTLINVVSLQFIKIKGFVNFYATGKFVCSTVPFVKYGF